MGHGYKVVQWTPFKKAYDLALAIGVGVFLAVFIIVTATASPAANMHPVQLVLRATGVTAFALLQLVLAIGPLARLTNRAKPLLYNRRHLGVATFCVALVHAALVILWYHGFSETNPFVSLFASNPEYASIGGFPFESLGFAALVILFMMAATSHDFWNANLGPRVWKGLHMGVYVAYGLLVAHVMLGVVQDEKSPVYAIVVGGGVVVLSGLHLLTGLRERGRDVAKGAVAEDGWVSAGKAAEIPENRAVILVLKGGERVAVFRYDGKVSAISNVCRHQGGPLGEGCVKDGLVTCPWHGFQYRPHDGASPEPYTEKVATYRVKVEAGEVFVDPEALAPGTPVEPAAIEGGAR